MNYEEVACNFVDWLVKNHYISFFQGIECTNEMVKEFIVLEEKAPMLFGLLDKLSKT